MSKDIDYEILNFLKHNGISTAVTINNHTGISYATVTAHLFKLKSENRLNMEVAEDRFGKGFKRLWSVR